MSFGVMGGFMQPQGFTSLLWLYYLIHNVPGHVQVLLNMLRGWSVQDALDAPRFCISPGLPDAPIKEADKAGNINSEVYFEPGISDQVLATLRSMFLLEACKQY